MSKWQRFTEPEGEILLQREAHMKSPRVITDAAKRANYATIKRFEYLSFPFYSPSPSSSSPNLAASAGSPASALGDRG